MDGLDSESSPLTLIMRDTKTLPRPFLKWAGSKKQLLKPIRDCILRGLKDSQYSVFVDGFLGCGAVTFMFLNELAEISGVKHFVANDYNADLILCFQMVKERPVDLIKELKRLEFNFRNATVPEDYYLKIRAYYNDSESCSDPVERSAILVFLNHTCFNGLYRVNSLGAFNVPFNKNPNSKIFDQAVLVADSILFQSRNVQFCCGDFQVHPKWYRNKPGETLFYFDPPYRPLTPTSSFRRYTKSTFDESEQLRLAQYCVALCNDGAGVVTSNSYTQVDYYQKNYNGFTLETVQTTRYLNACVKKRGIVKEVLLSRFS